MKRQDSSLTDKTARLRAELSAALDSVYMSPSTFLIIFEQTPEQAIAALRKAPEVFGTLRTYLGPITLCRNVTRVARLAEQIRHISR